MAQFNSIKAKNECAYAWHWRVDANTLIIVDLLGLLYLDNKTYTRYNNDEKIFKYCKNKI